MEVLMGGRMTSATFRVSGCRIAFLIALTCLFWRLSVFAQEQSKPPAAPEAAKKPGNPAPPKPHRFWDKENDWLFAGVGASRTLDYFSPLWPPQTGALGLHRTYSRSDRWSGAQLFVEDGAHDGRDFASCGAPVMREAG